MHIIAVNGSPRRTGNTATLLKHALEGAESAGAQTKLVNLYSLSYTGCVSCFACKRKGSACNGLCAVKDDLRAVLSEILMADGLLIGSPVYFGDVTGQVRCFLERLLFPNLSYGERNRSLFNGRLKTGLIYTMNVPRQELESVGYDKLFVQHQGLMRLFGPCEILLSCDTWQFDDYAKYDASRFNVTQKEELRRTQFPLDCQAAYALGARLAGKE